MIVGHVVGFSIRKRWTYCWSCGGGITGNKVGHVVGRVIGHAFLVGRVG